MYIPVIDFAGYKDDELSVKQALAKQIHEALHVHGFMAIKNIGISSAEVARIFAVSQAFFALPEAQKLRSAYLGAQYNFGFQAVCDENLDPSKPGDIKETITLRFNQHDRANRFPWPSAEFRQDAQYFYQLCLNATFRLMRVLSCALSLPDDYFIKVHSDENISLRLLHYPAVAQDTVMDQQLGCGAHTDYGLVTLLFQDNAGGLEIQDRNGQWHDVEPMADTIIINTGDLMERWSNGIYRSTPHRVRPQTQAKDRYSIAFFVDPASETVIETLPSCISEDNPNRYGPITAGEHLQERLAATHLVLRT
ncbi:isopenicillin N synthase family dioxygenase [Alteromonas lipolytica]|uniref:isopenicillin N synthase family dioxygenase n=1 Tax=Alteromonas lipolytica TaxID=1856405 RepID=UPI001586158A|nr:isopenicillin N synthase family oxygenase [Alteromonas lipolytica]GGF72324.1 2OG-Fe(II) oxygenase [Alteromonas lipolytica]